MISENVKALIQYRIEQADESLEAASLLLQRNLLRRSVNIAYYAMFYALLDLLATKQLGTSRHSGALSLFDREFVKPGQFSPELSRSLHLAFERRQTHDYGELIPLNREEAQRTLDAAVEFLAAIETYLRSTRHLADTAEE